MFRGDTCPIGIPGATAKDKENRRIPAASVTVTVRGKLAATSGTSR
jgi:uncharacterized Zn-binding protein involved in type VI secretion